MKPYIKRWGEYNSLADQLAESLDNNNSFVLTTKEFLKTLKRMRDIVKRVKPIQTMINLSTQDLAMLIIKKAVQITKSDYNGNMRQYQFDCSALAQYLLDFSLHGLEYNRQEAINSAQYAEELPKALLQKAILWSTPSKNTYTPKDLEKKETQSKKQIRQKVLRAIRRNGWNQADNTQDRTR